MKQALLLVSFGTSVPHARESIDAVEQAMCRTAPDWTFCRAFTSPTIRRILKQRGETVLSLEEALDQLASRGYQTVAVQRTAGVHVRHVRVDGPADERVKLRLGQPVPRLAHRPGDKRHRRLKIVALHHGLHSLESRPLYTPTSSAK